MHPFSNCTVTYAPQRITSTLHRRNLKMQLNLIQRLDLPSTLIRHAVTLFENSVQYRGIWIRRLCVLLWVQNILKRELFEDNIIKIIMWFHCPSFLQTQIQNDQWFLRFQIFSGLVLDGLEYKKDVNLYNKLKIQLHIVLFVHQ